MARIRTVKPEFFDDEKIAQLSEGAQLTYIGLWVFADDEGIIRSSTSWLKSKIFPHKPKLKLSKFDGWITELTKLVRLYHFTYNGEGYFIIINFSNHQRIDKPQASKLPKTFISEIRGILLEHSKNIPALNSISNHKGKGEGIGKGNSFSPSAEIPKDEKPVKAKTKEEKKGSAPKKEESTTPHWAKLVDVWFSFYKLKKEIEPTFEGVQAKALKSIVDNLQKRSEGRGFEWTEQKATETLQMFLEYAYKDKWISENFLLPNLNNKFDSIVAPKKGQKINSELEHLNY